MVCVDADALAFSITRPSAAMLNTCTTSVSNNYAKWKYVFMFPKKISARQWLKQICCIKICKIVEIRFYFLGCCVAWYGADGISLQTQNLLSWDVFFGMHQMEVIKFWWSWRVVAMMIWTQNTETSGFLTSSFPLTCLFNSLTPGRCGSNFKTVISEHMSQIKFMSTSLKFPSGEYHRTSLMP